MRISRVIPRFDYVKLSASYQVFALRSSSGRLGYADEVFDKLSLEATIVSVVFMGRGEAWVMTQRQQNATAVVRAALAGRDDMAFREERSLERVDEHTMLQLCLCSIAGDAGMEGASNVCGRLIVVSLGKPNTEYFRDTGQISVIHALEVSISPRMELELRVRTFTSCAARRFNRSMPRFELVDGRHLRRVASFEDPDSSSLFCQRARFEGDRYGGFFLLDASDQDSFSRSKLGVLGSALACLEYLFDGAVHVDFEEAKDVRRIDCVDSKLSERIALVASRIGDEAIYVFDATGKLGKQADLVVGTLNDTFGIRAVHTDSDMGGTLSIRLVREKSAYADGEGDPYYACAGSLVQHMTPESGFTKTAIAVAVKELAIKADVVASRMSLFSWEFGDWEFAAMVSDAKDGSFAFLQVGADGSMCFEGPVSPLGAMSNHSSLVNALLLNEGCEFAVRGPEGDVNVVSRTELFGIPNYETIWRDLLDRREDRRVSSKGKPMKYAIGRGKADRDLYFADAVDIAICSTEEGHQYYRVGMRGYGMQFGATHKASILREVIAIGGSRPLAEDMLPMLDVSMVRWGQPTVLPFPIKYLREWVGMNVARG